jgi:hypothetical protein
VEQAVENDWLRMGMKPNTKLLRNLGKSGEGDSKEEENRKVGIGGELVALEETLLPAH